MPQVPCPLRRGEDYGPAAIGDHRGVQHAEGVHHVFRGEIIAGRHGLAVHGGAGIQAGPLPLAGSDLLPDVGAGAVLLHGAPCQHGILCHQAQVAKGGAFVGWLVAAHFADESALARAAVVSIADEHITAHPGFQQADGVGEPRAITIGFLAEHGRMEPEMLRNEEPADIEIAAERLQVPIEKQPVDVIFVQPGIGNRIGAGFQMEAERRAAAYLSLRGISHADDGELVLQTIIVHDNPVFTGTFSQSPRTLLRSGRASSSGRSV